MSRISSGEAIFPPHFASGIIGLQSGQYASGTIRLDFPSLAGGMPALGPAVFRSGALLSGYGFFPSRRYDSDPDPCQICGKDISIVARPGYVVARAGKLYCEQCAGWREDLQRFETRQDWILDSVPFLSGTPLGILADWLEEQGRSKDAAYLRGRQ